jgi:predicted phage terminase large subunit-like protein
MEEKSKAVKIAWNKKASKPYKPYKAYKAKAGNENRKMYNGVYRRSEISNKIAQKKKEAPDIDEILEVKIKTAVEENKESWNKAFDEIRALVSKEGRAWDKVKDNELVEERYKALVKEKAHDSYLNYVRLTSKKLIETRFHLFLAMLAQEVMDKAELGYDQRITISCPPRAGKSTMIARRMPSYWLGRHPDVEVMCLSADIELATDFGDNNRQTALDVWKDVFGIEVSKAFKSKHSIGVEGNKGIMRFRGVGSTNVGKGGNMIIVDDPYPDEEFVNNATQRKRLLSALENDIFSRSERKKYDDKELGSIIFIIHTRRHEEDLIGVCDKVYVRAEESPTGVAFKRWLNVTIPAIATSTNDPLGRKVGEALMPEMGFAWTIKGLNLKKAEVGSRAWNSQFQQNPMTEHGNYIKKEWLENTWSYAELPVVFDDIILSCDLSNNAKSTSDFSAFQVWASCGVKHYLLDRGKARRTFNGQIEIMRQFVDKWAAKGHPIRKLLIEKRATGEAAVELLKTEMKQVAVIGFDVGYTDKVQRIQTASPYFEGGNVYLPPEKVDNKIEEYKQTMMLFPSVSFDDEVDATSQYFIYRIKQTSGKMVIDKDGFYSKLGTIWRS